MRKYYLFVIKKDVYEVYKDKPEILYKTLYKLRQLKNDNFEYGWSLYHQLCEPFDVERLEEYMESKYHLIKKNNKYTIDNNYLYIRPSRVIIKTKVNMPNIFIDFKCYNRLIFAIDFDMHDYFFLCSDYNKFKKIEYN